MDKMREEVIIKKITDLHGARIASSLAYDIWTEHYTPIIGPLQVKYMLEKFQSAEKIFDDISSGGYIYNLAYIKDGPVGYCAYKPDVEAGTAFLSKLYVRKSMRGIGVAKKFLKVITDDLSGSCRCIWLTVNKNNTDSINAYRKLGFEITGDKVTDIGSGFVMDDYIMHNSTSV